MSFCGSAKSFKNRANVTRLYLKGQFLGLLHRNQLWLSLNNEENCWSALTSGSGLGSTHSLPKQVPQIFSRPELKEMENKFGSK